MLENKIFKKKRFLDKMHLGEALFPPLVRAKKQNQNFEKHLKQKGCAIRRLSVPNFCYFQKNRVNMVKNVKKKCSKSLIM